MKREKKQLMVEMLCVILTVICMMSGDIQVLAGEFTQQEYDVEDSESNSEISGNEVSEKKEEENPEQKKTGANDEQNPPQDEVSETDGNSNPQEEESVSENSTDKDKEKNPEVEAGLETESGAGSSNGLENENPQVSENNVQSNEEEFIYIIQNEEAIITGYKGEKTDIVIPETIDTHPVKKIAASSFENNMSITTLIIPVNVTEIGSKAFSGCSHLSEMTINAARIDKFDAEAFSGCTSLRKVNFGKDVNSIWRDENGQIYGEAVEEYCVESSNSSFISIEGIVYMWVDGEHTRLRMHTYPLCRQAETFELSSDVVEVSKYAFAGCRYLKKLMLGDNIQTLETDTICNCPVLERISFGKSIRQLKDEAVKACQCLTQIEIEGNIQYVYDMADSFADCGKISTVMLGAEVTSFEYKGWNCDTLESIVVDDKNQIFYSYDGILYQYLEDGMGKLLCCPIARIGEGFEFHSKTKMIGEDAFKNNKYLESIRIPVSVKEVGQNAFLGCVSLKEVTIETAEECIWDSGTFFACSALERVSIISGIKILPAKMFYACSNLKTVFLGQDVYSFHLDTFAECYKLEKFEVNANNQTLASVNGVLFNKAGKKLLKYPAGKTDKEYIFGKNITDIAPNAFADAVILESIVFNGTIKSVPANAFEKCTGLKNISGWSAVEEIGQSAFSDCKSLERINLPESLLKIGSYAFQRCNSIIIIQIPDSVQEIGRNAITVGTIVANKGTVGYEYAVNNKIPVVEPEEEDEDDNYYPNVGGISEWDGKSLEKVEPIGKTYLIKNAAQLAWIASVVNEGSENFSGKIIRLLTDIDLMEYEWIPIGNSSEHYFAGSFDGQGNTIYSLRPSKKYDLTGLFGMIKSVSYGRNIYIRNITLKNVEFLTESDRYMGSVAGCMTVGRGVQGVIDGCYVEGEATGKSIAGVVGLLSGGAASSEIRVRNCHVKMAMTALCQNAITDTSVDAGGIVCFVRFGKENGDNGLVVIESCSYEGEAKGTSRYGRPAGILVDVERGYGKLEIRNCDVRGKISPGTSVAAGGIVAEIPSGTLGEMTIFGCINEASVSGYYAGGILGNAAGTVSIEQCMNKGEISGISSGTCYGGIVGAECAETYIRNCFNRGVIRPTQFGYNGGIVGINAGRLENCYNIGRLPNKMASVLAVNLPGAMASQNPGEIVHCYFDMDLTEGKEELVGADALGESDNVRIDSIGLSSSQMKSASSLNGWDFESVWDFDPEYNFGYPVLSVLKSRMSREYDLGTGMEISDKDQYIFTIVDEKGKPVEGVSLSFGSAEGVSNISGKIEIPYTKDRAMLTVSKEGYGTYKRQYTMNDRAADIIRIPNLAYVSEYGLISVLMECGGQEYELLTENKEINYQNEKKEILLTCEQLEINRQKNIR